MRLQEVIQLQGALNPTLFSHIKNICMGNLNWAYCDNSAYGGLNRENQSNGLAFSNLMYTEQQRVSEMSGFFESALMIILDKIDLKIFNLKRIRIGMMTRSDQNYINDPHIDDNEEHITALLYLNTCNAPTILYDEFYDNTSQKSILEYLKSDLPEELKVYKEIPCIENNVVVFNGFRYHSSTIQTDIKRRIVVNYNFTLL